jgi:hypothetical protein
VFDEKSKGQRASLNRICKVGESALINVLGSRREEEGAVVADP